MNPQCQNCGKIVALRMGLTTEVSSSKPVFGLSDNKVYLCVICSNKPEVLDRYKKAPWYASHKVI